jgi:hypothetical protein
MSAAGHPEVPEQDIQKFQNFWKTRRKKYYKYC